MQDDSFVTHSVFAGARDHIENLFAVGVGVQEVVMPGIDLTDAEGLGRFMVDSGIHHPSDRAPRVLYFRFLIGVLHTNVDVRHFRWVLSIGLSWGKDYHPGHSQGCQTANEYRLHSQLLPELRARFAGFGR